MRFPGFSQVCPAGSTRDPSRGQKIGCHIENLHATNFFLGRMMGKILWAVHLVPITLMSCDGLLVCVCFWVYIYKVMFLGEWSFKGHVLVVTSAPNAHPAKINKHLQDIHIYILCSKHISWYHVEKQEKVMRQCTRLKLSSLKYAAKQGNHDLWAVMRPGCRIFAAPCVFILLHAERQAKSKVFHFTTNFEY